MATLADYFYFIPRESGAIGVCRIDDPDVRPRLQLTEPLVDWEPPLAVLENGGPADYLATDIFNRLFSPRLREALDRLRGPDDDLEWLPCHVQAASGDVHMYYFLRVPSHPEVLSPDRSIRAGDFVVNPVFDRARVGTHRVFSFEPASTRIIVAEEVKKALEAEAFTGMVFERAPAV